MEGAEERRAAASGALAMVQKSTCDGPADVAAARFRDVRGALRDALHHVDPSRTVRRVWTLNGQELVEQEWYTNAKKLAAEG